MTAQRTATISVLTIQTRQALEPVGAEAQIMSAAAGGTLTLTGTAPQIATINVRTTPAKTHPARVVAAPPTPVMEMGMAPRTATTNVPQIPLKRALATVVAAPVPQAPVGVTRALCAT